MVENVPLIESERLTVDYRLEGGVLVVYFRGTLDEDANLGYLLELLGDAGSTIQMLQFDLGAVAAVNSCGLREWLLLMEQLAHRQTCAFVNVPEAFVDQANMILNVFGPPRNQVLSFQAPYHCGQCNQEELHLLDPTQLPTRAGRPVAPAFQCSHCGSPLQFDSIEEEYFEFVRRMGAARVDE